MDEPEHKKVGYGRPPKQHQFKPGQSGNPNGRPKGAKSLKGLMAQLMDQKITISDQSGTRQVTRKQAVAMRVIEKATRGDLKSIQLLIGMDSQTEADEIKAATNLTPSELQMLEELLAPLNRENDDD